jgi:hypothetical protein
MNYNEQTLIEMLGYMRPQDSTAQEMFCDKYLLPIMGKPDAHGNYILSVGNRPNIAFMAHHDTVHRDGGLHKPHVSNKGIVSTNTDCLGADCTTGVWLILAMIQAKVTGLYVVHAAEEVGCIGSRAIVDDKPSWIADIQAAISFDRRGYDSIVTHQMGERTASDAFAVSLNDALGLQMKPDSTGSFTDSNEYAYVIDECTNISVGYHGQHTSRETQDMPFAMALRDRLIQADWSGIVIKRDAAIAYDDIQASYKGYGQGGKYNSYQDTFRDGRYDDEDDDDELMTMADLVYENPEEIADLLLSYGFNLNDLREELGANT